MWLGTISAVVDSVPNARQRETWAYYPPGRPQIDISKGKIPFRHEGRYGICRKIEEAIISSENSNFGLLAIGHFVP